MEALQIIAPGLMDIMYRAQRAEEQRRERNRMIEADLLVERLERAKASRPSLGRCVHCGGSYSDRPPCCNVGVGKPHVNTDSLLAGTALVELVSRPGGAGPLVEYCAMESVECGHQLQTLFLADALVRIAD
jgi:hypothetical protein